MATVTYTMVTSRLGYCNSPYAGLPLYLTRKLHSVQKTTTHMLTSVSVWKHMQPVLCSTALAANTVQDPVQGHGSHL